MKGLMNINELLLQQDKLACDLQFPNSGKQLQFANMEFSASPLKDAKVYDIKSWANKTFSLDDILKHLEINQFFLDNMHPSCANLTVLHTCN